MHDGDHFHPSVRPSKHPASEEEVGGGGFFPSGQMKADQTEQSQLAQYGWMALEVN